MTDLDNGELAQRIEVIEKAYEYMLAYAAQGYEASHEAQQNNDVRLHLDAMNEALDNLDEIAKALLLRLMKTNLAHIKVF